MKKWICLIIIISFSLISLHAAYILLPMDMKQKDHLKAYGITYLILQKEVEAHWLLNYRGGSFAFPHRLAFEKECNTKPLSKYG
jgi:hypothetical protein